MASARAISTPNLAGDRSPPGSDEDYLYTFAEDIDALREVYHLLRRDEKTPTSGTSLTASFTATGGVDCFSTKWP
jgi:hypothetical protein